MKWGKESSQEGHSGELCGCKLCSDADILLSLAEEVLSVSGEETSGLGAWRWGSESTFTMTIITDKAF